MLCELIKEKECCKIKTMEREKYYTPQIEEFCVGFECEVNWNKGYKDNFVPLVIDVKDKNGAYTNTLQEVIRAYDDRYAEFRVRCLNSSDIESLGWKSNKLLENGWEEYKMVKNEKIFTIFKTNQNDYIITLTFEENSNPLNIYTLFKGKIKNKSELKKLLQMFEI